MMNRPWVPLSKVDWEQLAVGDECISAIGNRGVIKSLNRLNNFYPHLEHWIEIEWSNGNTSFLPQDDDGGWMCEHVRYPMTNYRRGS